MKKISNQPQCIVESNDLLGEGPIWCSKTQMIYWLDILQKKIHRYRPKDGYLATQIFTERFTAISPTEREEWIGLTPKAVALVHPHLGKWREITRVETDQIQNRFNDGKCDSKGRYWAGTMNEEHMEQPDGALYRINGSFQVKQMATGISLCNGLAWSPDKKTMYVIETLRFTIIAYDFDPEEGKIANRRIFTQFDRKSQGGPDGLTVDADGFVWCAHYGTGQILRFSPEGKIVSVLHLPVPNVTSCAFGGESYDTLFITTARQEMDEQQLANAPLAGGLFACCPGVKGLAETPFRFD